MKTMLDDSGSFNKMFCWRPTSQILHLTLICIRRYFCNPQMMSTKSQVPFERNFRDHFLYNKEPSISAIISLSEKCKHLHYQQKEIVKYIYDIKTKTNIQTTSLHGWVIYRAILMRSVCGKLKWSYSITFQVFS